MQCPGCQRFASENRMRCEGRQSEGTGCSSGRLRASAFTFWHLAHGACDTSKVMRRIEASSAMCSSTRPKGCFVYNILLRPDSAPVLSQREGRQRGALQQGASAERPRSSPACARASQLAISLARSLPKGMPTSSKSETEKDSENQTCPREGLETKHPGSSCGFWPRHRRRLHISMWGRAHAGKWRNVLEPAFKGLQCTGRSRG